MGTDRGMSAVLRMKRSLELANAKKERLQNALARVKGHPDSAYAARLVQSARRAAGQQDSVVRRQVSRIHEMIDAAVDGDVTSIRELIDEALRERIDELTGKGNLHGISHAYKSMSDTSHAMSSPTHRWHDAENEKEHERESNIYNLRHRRALSMAKAVDAKKEGGEYGDEDYARHKENAQNWKKKQKAAGTIDREERQKAQRKAYVQSKRVQEEEALDELTGKDKLFPIAYKARNQYHDDKRTAAQAKIYHAPETLKKAEKDAELNDIRSRRAMSLGKSLEAKNDGDTASAAHHMSQAKDWKSKYKIAKGK